METKKFNLEKELTNEGLEKVLGGTAASKISVTISMTQTSVAASAGKKTDSDSDAETIKTNDQASIEAK